MGYSGLCPQGHWKVGKGKQNHQETVTGKEFLGGKTGVARVDKTNGKVTSSLFQISLGVVRILGVSS